MVVAHVKNPLSTFRQSVPVWQRECVCVCVCVCVCGRNELEVCTTLAYPHISSFCTMPVLYTQLTHSRILKLFEDSKLADRAKT